MARKGQGYPCRWHDKMMMIADAEESSDIFFPFHLSTERSLNLSEYQSSSVPQSSSDIQLTNIQYVY